MKTTPYWWDTATEVVQTASQPLRDVELCIVGSGYTGLSAAITAAGRGAEVLVLDAQNPGEGASTRNGGMIGAPHRPGFVGELKTYGEDLASRLAREGDEAYAFSRDLYTGFDDQSEFRESGRIQFAYTLDHLSAMRERVEIMRKYTAQQVEIIERGALSQHINSELYFGALYYPDHGGLNPKAAHNNLLRRAVETGVTVCGNCPVLDIQRTATGFELKTSNGSVRARKLIVATNGYTTRAISYMARRVFRIPSFMIATEELPDETIRRVAPGMHMMVESRARHSYFRPSPDGKRIIFGGRAALTPIGLEKAAVRLKETLTSIWPEASAWKISHCWSGFTGFTFARIPHVGEHDGLHFAMGYCGNGVALSPWLGHKVALQALGEKEGDTAFSETRLETRSYHWGGAPWFMQLANPWWRYVVDTLETRQAKRDQRATAL